MPQFPSTQWSLIRQSGASATGRDAFAELVRAYRSAILAFFRARLPNDTAEDATQSFLALSYEHAWWSRADAQLGTFRSFLLVLLRRHLGHLRAIRRIAVDAHADVAAIADDTPGAERQFDLRFALALTARAVDAQRLRYAERGREALFDRLVPLLSSPPEYGELKAVADELDLAANTLTVEIRRLRQRLREHMRAQVEGLCADAASFESEWAAVQRILEGG